MNIWKQLGTSVVLGLLIGGITGCRGQTFSSTSPAPKQLEFWTMQLQPEFKDYFDERIKQFEAVNPGIDVRWVDIPWSAMESKILTAVSAGTAPDVVNLNPSFASQLAAREAWLDLDARVSDQIRQQYLPNIWQASTFNGKSFGLPWYLTTQVLFFNQDLLKQAGLGQPPSTYAELVTAAQQIKAKTGKYAFFLTVVPEDSAEVLESLVQMGVKLVDGEGKAAFNTPQGRAAFQYWVTLYQQKLLPPAVLTQGHRHGIELYQAGEVAMLSAGVEFLETIRTNAPAIAQASGITSQLTGSTGKRNVAVMNLVIPRTSDDPDDALQFALFITNPENQLTFAQAAHVLPSTVKSLKDYEQELNRQGTQPTATLEQGLVVSVRQLYNTEVLVPAMTNVKGLQKILYENLQAAMLGTKSVDQALADAEQAWNSKR